MQTFFSRCVVIFFFFFLFTAQLQAVDIDGDGSDDFFSYYLDSSSLVAQSSVGEILGDVTVPLMLLGESPILIAGKSAGNFVAYSVVAGKSGQNAVLYQIQQDGIVHSRVLGDLRGGVFMMYDLNGDENTDLLVVRKNGVVEYTESPFTDKEQLRSFLVPSLKRTTRVTIGYNNNSPHLVLYRTQKRKKITSFRYLSLFDGNLRAFTQMRKRFRTQILPYTSSSPQGINGSFISFKRARNGVVKSFTEIRLQESVARKTKIAPSTTILPGYFQSQGSARQLLRIGKTIQVVDVERGATPLVELAISADIAQRVAFVGAPLVSFQRTKRGRTDEICNYLQDGKDGPSGFLLKASDEDRNLVVLLPSAIPTAAVTLTTHSGKLIESLRHTGRSNGFRGTYRGSKPPTAYPREVMVRVTLGNESLCYKIDNSHIRND